MKAISLWQPWAQLCVLGEKRIETRGYKTNVRGRVAIHAAMKPLQITTELRPFFFQHGLSFFQRGAKMPSGLALGAIVGTVEIIDCVPLAELVGGPYDTPKERASGDWSEGRWGWILRDPVCFEAPVPAKGRQGFWNWEGDER